MEITREAVAALVVGIILIAAAVFALYNKHIRKNRNKRMDTLEGYEFEYYCAGLLEDCGFSEVEVTRASGDFGVDILAQKEGVTYAIQCKRYNEPVGIRAVQEIYFGRDYYDCMVGCVMTNQYFTQPAVDAAQKLKILLWDRDFLEAMDWQNCH